MNRLLRSVKKHHDLRFLGQLNLIESYQNYCYETYGCFEGTTDKNGVREGVVCHQQCAVRPEAADISTPHPKSCGTGVSQRPH